MSDLPDQSDKALASPSDSAAPSRPPQARRDAAAYAQSVAGARPSTAAGVTQGDGLYRLLVESVRDYAIFALDPTGHIISWNRGAQRAKGYAAEEIIGKHFSIFYPPEDVASGKPAWELEVATDEGRVEDEGWRVRKDGSRFWANVVITALRDETGALVGFAKVTRDLTERRRVEQALRDSEERFRLIIQSVRDYAIFMLDPNGRVASWNEGAERIKGWAPSEIIGKHFSIFYQHEDIVAGKPVVEIEVATRTGRFEDEGWRLRKDGTRFWANVVLTAIRNDAGELLGFAKVTRDLTERRAAEERALADARRLAEVEASARTKSEFLAAMSHELRTPLNAIGGYAELLVLGLGGPVTDAQRQYLERIRGSQSHLLSIINDILNFSRLEAGRLAYDIGPVLLREVIDTVVPMIQPQADAKGLRVAYHPRNEAIALADQPKVEQILLNLLSNAVKFTPEGGSIDITSERRGDRAIIRVRDTGIGIPADKLEAVFEPFVQIGRSLVNPHEGTGLGLAISRDLARGMHGELTVESSLDQGSTFTVALPAEG